MLEVKKLKEKLQKIPRISNFWIILIATSLIPLLWFKGNLVIAGGDNTHNYLDFGRRYAVFTTWDDSTNLGSPSRHLHNLPLPLAASLLRFVPDHLFQKILFCFLTFSRLGLFYLVLKKLFPQETRVSTLLPPILLFAFNPFYLTDQISLVGFLVPIQMSLVFLVVHKIVAEKAFDLKYLLALSLTNAFLFSNPPAMVVTYLPGALYFLSSFFHWRRSLLPTLSRLFLTITIFGLLSLWYLLPSVKALQEVAQKPSPTVSYEMTKLGRLRDHLRLIGQWSWYEKYYLSDYVPYAKNYDRLPLLASTYGLVFFAGLSVFTFRQRKIFPFFLGLFVLGLILASGSKPPLGDFYLKIYRAHPFFSMFREPWVKFTPLQVFSLPILLYGALSRLHSKFSKIPSVILWLPTTFIIFLNVYPIFTGEVIWDKWNGSMRSFHIAVPQYWQDLKSFLISHNLQDERILTLPASRYGMAYNWPNGVSSPTDIASFLLPNPFLSFNSLPTQKSDDIVNQFYNTFWEKNFPYEGYLSLLGTQYLLQENDVDWRYSPHDQTPSQLTKFLSEKNLKVVKTFGSFDQKYLETIPNAEPDKTLRESLSRELAGQPALVLYQIEKAEKQPPFYSPQEVIFSPNGIEILLQIDQEDFSPQTAFYLQESHWENPKLDFLGPSKIYIEGKKIPPQSDCENSCYQVAIPEEKAYEILVDKEKLTSLGALSSTLVINKQKFFPQPQKENDRWVAYSKTLLSFGQYLASLDLPAQSNILDDKNWQQVRITKENKLVYPEPQIYQEIKNWGQADFFVISFQYQARYGKLGFAILEDLEEVFKVELDSKNVPNDWVTFQKTIPAHSGKKGSLCFYYLPDNPLASQAGDGNFREVSAVPIYQPTLLLRFHTTEEKLLPTQPQINSTKISSAKYAVQISQAKNPFLLVFSDTFHPDWTLRLDKSKKLVANSRHLVINGYANAWYIIPGDVGQQQNYTLVAEFRWQKYLQWGALISGGTLVGCLVFLLGHLYRRPKPYF